MTQKHHSTVGRRDFMKALGLGAAGVAATAAAAPIFKDLDEAAGSVDNPFPKRSWWVKEVEEPTVEIAWDQIKRRNQTGFPAWNMSIPWPTYDGAEHAAKYEEMSKKLWPKYKGRTVRDAAYSNAATQIYDRAQAPYSCNLTQFGLHRFVPNFKPEVTTPSPEEAGFAKWEGTPEENLKMVRAVLSIVGIGPSIGVIELTERNKKLVWSKTNMGKAIVFDDDIKTPYVTGAPPNQEYHVPSSLRYVIVSNNMEMSELTKRGAMASPASFHSYARTAYAKHYFECFMKGIGYNVAYDHYMQPASPFGYLAGTGEHCRMSHVTLSPEYGNFPRTNFIIYTDLPLAVSGPIDAGIMRFCESCGMCADHCPKDAMPLKGVGPNWEPQVDQNWADDRENGGSVIMWNSPGYKGWRCDNFKCQGGAHCRGACPFNTIGDGSFIHSIVKATASTTGIFNSFFVDMEARLHYANQDADPESWWTNEKGWFIYGMHPQALYPTLS